MRKLEESFKQVGAINSEEQAWLGFHFIDDRLLAIEHALNGGDIETGLYHLVVAQEYAKEGLRLFKRPEIMNKET